MENSNRPLVSICIPTYNGARYIAEALESAIQQDYRPLEIVVSDDASTDATLDIVASFKSKTNIPIHVYKHNPKGIGANWNHCIKQAQGDYIKFLFQDDILKPACVSEMMQLMLSHQDVGMVYSTRCIIHEDSNPQHLEFINTYGALHTHWNALNLEASPVLKGTQYLKDANLFEFPLNKIGEPTGVLLKTSIIKQVGLFNEALKQALDIEYWYRVMPYCRVGFINKKLVGFRIHDKQTSAINAKNKVSESQLVYYIFYKELFWYVSNKNKKKLLLLFNTHAKWLKRLYYQLKYR